MTIKTELFEYQKEAVNKLIHLKVGALFLEQGLGKTRVTLELIKIRLEKVKINHILWLCPCSVKKNLELDIICHVGYLPNEITICGIESLSCSYRIFKEMDELVEKYNCMVVIDESILTKNFFAVRTKRIISLSNKCTYKIILNGTPISKNEADLFAQFYILDWRILGYKSYYSFAANHLEYDEYNKKVVRTLNTDYLARKIAPYTFQGTKDEYLDLPSKTYGCTYFSLTNEQTEEYIDALENYLNLIIESDDTTIYRLFTALQLVLSGRKIISEPRKKIETKPMFEQVEDNPRINELIRNIDTESKYIIFCKYSHEIMDVAKAIELEYGKGSYVLFNGSVKLKQRYQNIEIFRTSARFMIANKSCAGYGLNLQFCNKIIYYSNDWDLATRLQSEDRVYRIGQNKKVEILDIVSYNKLDERILDCINKKSNLAEVFKKNIGEQTKLKAWLGGKK